MSSFSGFSEADILKLQNGEKLTSPPKNPAQQHTVISKKHPQAFVPKAQNSNKPKQETRKKQILENKLNSNQDNPKIDLPDEAKLGNFVNITLTPSDVDKTENIDKNVKAIKGTVHSTSDLPQNTEIEKLTREINHEKKIIDFNEFKLKQKYMEEQNRIRKEQVAKALEDRTKRTQQEQLKLVAIEDEFKKLDATLSNDVKILRKQIENASYEYMEAQKRYHRIEKEFLEAKLYLHQKLEKKEMLTEHLCAIIEMNEERKADKLNELLVKLEVLDSNSSNDDSHVITNEINDNNDKGNGQINVEPMQNNEITSNQ